MNATQSSLGPLRQRLAAYQTPSVARSLLEVASSAGPLALLWVGAWVATAFGLWWISLLLAIPAAGFLVRLFAVQHDCSHRAFFKSAAANDWVGRAIGVLTMTPHDHWRRIHALHHASSGNLDRRGPGEVSTLTVDEYRARCFWRRLGYRLYRHPLVLFGLGPAFLFLFQQRLPTGLMREGWLPWASAMGTNAVIAMLIGIAVWLGQWPALLLVHLPTVLVAGSIGVWLFYVQHQFEHTYWRHHQDWEATDAALNGSSYYVLPHPLQWITANIGVHHVHHLNSRIPFYRLPAVMKDNPEMANTSRLTIADSLRCVRLSLWDETNKRLISFKQFNETQRAHNRAPLPHPCP